MSCGSQKSTANSNTSSATNSTATTSAPQPYEDAYSNVLAQAQQTANSPLQQYQGNIVAPFSQDQLSAFNSIDGASGTYQPNLQAAQGFINNSAQNIWGNTQQFSPQAVQQYMNPYTQQVVDATQAQFNNQNAQQFNQANGATAAAGAFGGDRSAVLKAQLAGQQQASQAPVIAGLYNQDYSQAQGEFNTQQQNQIQANEATAGLNAQAGFGSMNLAQLSQSLPLQQAMAQLQSGNQQQQQTQAGLNVPYEQFLQQQAYPFQTNSWLAALSSGLGGAAGGTTTGNGTNVGAGTNVQTTPGASIFSQVAGLGLTAAGMGLFKDGGSVRKNNVIPFRRRAAGGGMSPYQEIQLSGAVPDVDQNYIPDLSPFSKTSAPSVMNPATMSAPTISSKGSDSSQSDPLGMAEGIINKQNGTNGNSSSGGLSSFLGGLFSPNNPMGNTPLSDMGTGGSGAGNIFLGADGLVSSGKFKRGGMVHRDMGGPLAPAPLSAEDDPALDPVQVTPENQAVQENTHYGILPPTHVALQQTPTDNHNALLAAGLGMLAGQSSNPFVNIGQGGLQGLKQWQADKAATQKQTDEQATVDEKNQSADLSYQEAVSRAKQLADDMDYRRTQANQSQSNSDRQFHQGQTQFAQTQKNEDAQRRIQQEQLDDANAGSWTYQGDDAQGNAIELNNKTGQLRNTGVPIAAKPSAGGAMGGGSRYAGQATRSLVAARDATSDLENIAELPVTSNTGMFGLRGGGGDGSLMHSAFNVLGNALTDQAAQDLNTTVVGLGRGLAGLESGGTASAGGKALMEQYEKLAPAKGDTAFTAMRKLATMRQNALNGIESNMASPYVSPDQKQLFQDAYNRVKTAIPYTPHDVTAYEVAASKNPQLTFTDYAKANHIGDARNVIPLGAIAHLKSDPSLRGAFDQKYGAGASAQVLGGQ